MLFSPQGAPRLAAAGLELRTWRHQGVGGALALVMLALFGVWMVSPPLNHPTERYNYADRGGVWASFGPGDALMPLSDRRLSPRSFAVCKCHFCSPSVRVPGCLCPCPSLPRRTSLSPIGLESSLRAWVMA